MKGGCAIVAVTDAFRAADHTVWTLDHYPVDICFATDAIDALQAVRLLQPEEECWQYDKLFDAEGRCISEELFSQMERNEVSRRVSVCNFNLALYYFRSDNSRYRPSDKAKAEMRFPPSSLSILGREMLAEIERWESVAVHIRRGDFMNPDNDLAVRSQYYIRACDDLRQRLQRPRFFVFSDDSEWARSLFLNDSDVVVNENRGPGFAAEDLFLGSQCRHFVLTNHSTYSHWMVELSAERPDRQVLVNSLEDLVTKRSISFYYMPSHCRVPDDVVT
ncbi:MAG: alpha-1,2-fucosyltransferase [Planctomycetaceae bacterium]